MNVAWTSKVYDQFLGFCEVQGEEERGEHSSLWYTCAGDDSVRRDVIQPDVLPSVCDVVVNPGSQAGFWTTCVIKIMTAPLSLSRCEGADVGGKGSVRGPVLVVSGA